MKAIFDVPLDVPLNVKMLENDLVIEQKCPIVSTLTPSFCTPNFAPEMLFPQKVLPPPPPKKNVLTIFYPSIIFFT